MIRVREKEIKKLREQTKTKVSEKGCKGSIERSYGEIQP